MPVLNRASAGTVAEMQGDQAQIAQITLQVSGGQSGDIGMGGAVEAVATDSEALGDFEVDRVMLGPPGHAQMERGVEDRDVR